jgi:hypothetical protein
LLLHLQQFLVAHLSPLKQGEAIDVHVVRSSLMINFPSQIVIFVPHLIEALPQPLDVHIEAVAHRMEPVFLFLALA